MNSKTIIKRTLPLIIALFVVIILAVSCTIFAKDKKAPSISNPDAAYLTNGNISISNGKVYNELKSQKGLDMLLTMIDRALLTRTLNKDSVSFYSAVSEQDITDAIEKAMFPNGRTGVAEDDDETIENWEKIQGIGYGLWTEQLRRDSYRLTLAKKAYAQAMLQEEYDESIENNNPDDEETYDDDLVDDEDIDNYYEANYKNTYWAIVVPFNTVSEAKAALSQLGIVVKQNDSSYDAWFWGHNDTELTEEEIKQAFIDLYNNVYSYKAPGYPNADPLDNAYLGDDQYTVTGGTIVFNTTQNIEDEDSLENLFHYTAAELDEIFYSSTSVSLSSYVKSMDAYMADGMTLRKTFTAQPKTWSSANQCYFVFKIDFETPEAQENVKDEIIQEILESKNTDAYIKTSMAELRKDNNILIYDATLESTYISSFDTEHSATKKESSTLVATIDELEISADELFTELSKKYGVLSSFDFYSNEYILYSEYNTIYNYETKTVLDEDEWEDIDQQIADIKTAFKANQFYNQGYGVSYGWENFLKNYYRVNNVEELKIHFLRQAVLQEFIDQVTDTEDLWASIYLPKMTEAYNDYLSASGIHLLISKTDADGELVDPKDWTVYEKATAEELYDNVLNRLTTVLPSKYQVLLETTIMTEFKNAPKFVSTLAQDVVSQPVYDVNLAPWVLVDASDYLYSKAKTCGLNIKFETLSGITAGQMVPEFEAAVRTIWDEAEANDTFGAESIIYDKTFDDYLVTKFGYHVYINTSTTNRTTLKVSNVDTIVPLPTMGQILMYEENDADANLTTLAKKSVTTYFSPIKAEIAGDYFYMVKLYEYYLGSIGDITYADATLNANGELGKIINYQIDNYYSYLTYVTNPDDVE
ncbi:MAG: hypothetical protein PHY42_01175 [Bacilli bacterium]|nr:hypothetical protein [Bacilli bacterium]